MDWVKKNWIVMVCGVVALAGIGVGVWAMLGFKEVQALANSIASIDNTLTGLERGAANVKAIEDAREYYKIANRETEAASKKAKENNRRDPLRDDVFPTAKAADSPYHFRNAYREAMRRLPQDLNAEKAPTGDVVDRIVSRMEEKAKREANVTTAGDHLTIPKPPDVPKIENILPAAIASPMGGRGGRGDDPYHNSGGRGEDPYRNSGGRGEDPYHNSGGRGEDPYRSPVGASGMTMPFRAGLGTSPLTTQAPVKLPTREELMPEAVLIATYETAKRIWTYIDDNSLDMHPIGYPAFVQAPDEVDMWSAQMYYWIEKDMIDALRRVNEQAAASLPEDQRWVAYLPVKHLVSLSISDYLTGGSSDVTGRVASISVLRRTSQSSQIRSGSAGHAAMSLAFGSVANAFTDRAGSNEYDVVHVALNLVVDARDLPKILVELCKQNFITPLDVQYRNVDVMKAREAGYLYGSGPVVNVDIVCEMLFFRSIYDDKKPEKVKKMLAGELVEDPSGGRGGGRY